MPETTETSTRVRHKRKLEQIREEHNARSGENGGGYSSPSLNEDGPAYGEAELTDIGGSSGAQGVEGQPGNLGGPDSGVGQADATPSNDNSSADQTGPEQPVTQPKDMEAERERKRELARQRKVRQRERQNATATTENQAQTSSKTGRDSDRGDENKVTFNLKNVTGKPEDVKVFTQKEAEESLQKLIFVYQRGSEILDDILEIVVKGHEKVQIWALSDDEATMFATMQMERAKKDKAAAKTVRTLISIYDRMYLFMIVGPRVVATGQHIKSHGGISFK